MVYKIRVGVSVFVKPPISKPGTKQIEFGRDERNLLKLCRQRKRK